MEGLGRTEKFRLITGSVMPRPIALVTTLNGNDSCNAAPFSAFNYVSDDPPLLAIGFDRYGDENHRPGDAKDTLANILARDTFVVNMVDEALLETAVACATDYPASVSETEALALELAPSLAVDVPRLAAAPIAWECRKHTILDVSATRTVMLGQIEAMYFRDDLLDSTALRVNAEKFHPMGRMGGARYAHTREFVTVPLRPFRVRE